jgi:hypothetical protein
MILSAILAVAIVFIADVDAYVTITIGLVGMIAIGVSEHFQYEHGGVDVEEEHMVEIGG